MHSALLYSGNNALRIINDYTLISIIPVIRQQHVCRGSINLELHADNPKFEVEQSCKIIMLKHGNTEDGMSA